MCGRFNLTDSPVLQTFLDELGIETGPLPDRYNIAPTEQALTIYQDDHGYRAIDMRWWLCPSWSDGPSQHYAMFNARAESIDNSRAFRGPFRRHRAIVPASSFIEWRTTGQGKQPFALSGASGLLLLAAIWDHWEGGAETLYSCALVTTRAHASMQDIHRRQPVMLTRSEARAWLDPGQDRETLEHLMRPAMPEDLYATPIDSTINHSRSKIAPTAVGEPLHLQA